MNPINLVLLITLIFLTIPLRTRFTASTLIGMYLLYQAFVVNLDGLLYYGGAATIDLIVAVFLLNMEKRHVTVAYLAILSIFVNFFGWMLYENHYDPMLYNTVALTVSCIQVLVLLTDYANARLYNDNSRVWVVYYPNTNSQKFIIKKEIAKDET